MTDTFQKRFIEAMQIRGMRQVDVAEKTGLDKAQISQYKTGKYEPMQDALYKLAKALNVNVAWLMGHDVPMDVDMQELEEKYKQFKRLSTYHDNLQVMNLLDMFNKLNPEGKSKVMAYVTDLTRIDRYLDHD